MIKQIASLEITIPTLIFLIYLTGFLSLNAHLHPYGIYETNALSFNYIKAGALFFLYNSSLVVLVHLSYQDKQNSTILDFVFNIFVVILLSVVVCGSALYLYEEVDINNIPFRISAKYPWITFSLFIANVLPLVSIIGLSDGEENTRRDKWLIWILFTGLLYALFQLIRYEGSVLFSITIYNVVAIGGFSLLISNLRSITKDSEDSLASLIPISGLVLLVVSLAFGKFIYPQIAAAIGGGKPYMSKLYLTSAEQENLIQSHVIPSSPWSNKSIQILYQTDKTLFIQFDHKVVGIAVDGIKAYELVK